MAKIAFIVFLLLNFFCYADEKIEINADQFTYDKDNTRIYATGNVEIIDKEFKLYANKVFVNNKSKVISDSITLNIKQTASSASSAKSNNGNVIGIQFHPEKSQKQGVKIFENFLNL